MKKLKRRFRQSLAGFLAFCLTMTSFHMVSWADVGKAFENENATFLISGNELRDYAQAAIDSGEIFHVEDLGLGDEDLSLKKEYEKLFGRGLVYEFMPSYDMDEEASALGAELRMFVRVPNHGGSLLTGEEEIIFLYVNESESRITFRSNIDGYLTQKASVKAFSENASAISGAAGAGVKPDVAEPGGSGVNQEDATTPGAPSGSGTEANPSVPSGSGTEGNPSAPSGSGTEANPSAPSGSGTEANPSSPADSGTEGNPSAPSGSGTEANPSSPADSGTEIKTSDPSVGGTEINSGETPSGDDKEAEVGNPDSVYEDDGAAETPEAGSAVGSSQDKENSDSQSGHEDKSAEGQEPADVQVSISRHVLPVLTDFSYAVSTASEADEAPIGGTTGGKSYGAVLLDESCYARAYTATLNQLHVDVSAEGYQVTYTVEPAGTAYAEGPEMIAENQALSFTVTPQIGYEVSAVTVNGETLEAEEAEGSDASDPGRRHYTITEVTGEQEVVITTAATGEHPEFRFEKMMNGVTVSLHAEQGILPAGTEARITEVTNKVKDAVREKSANVTGEESTVNDVLAYDIKLYYNGEELDNSWSDHGYVDVTFAGAPIKEKSQAADSIDILHLNMDVDVAAETVDRVSPEEVTALEAVAAPVMVGNENAVNEVSFEAEHFSTYTIRFVSVLTWADLKIHLMDMSTGKEIDYSNGMITESVIPGIPYSVSYYAGMVLDKLNLSKEYTFVKATLKNDDKDTSFQSFYFLLGTLYNYDTWESINGHVYFWFNSKKSTLTYDANTGQLPVPAPKQYEKGKTANVEFTSLPAKMGYVFLGWDENKNAVSPTYTESGTRSFVMPDRNVTLYAIWGPASSTAFHVKHWLQKSGTVGNKAGDFELAAGSPETKYAATESKIYDSAYAKTIGGYLYLEGLIDSKTEGTVNGDGATVLDLYYLRKYNIQVTGDTISRAYDGTPLTGGYQLTGGKLRDGDRLEVVLSGSITDAGQVTNHIESIGVKDAGGSVVTDKYDIVSNDGILTVTKAPVTVTAEDKAKKYGEDVPALTYTAEGLKNGETLERLNVKIEPYTGATKSSPVGDYVITFRNQATETMNYEISYKDGTLNIGKYPETIVVKALDESKIYDGTELTNAGYRMTGSLVSGDYIDHVVMTADSRIKDAGTQSNRIDSVVIMNGAGQDVTASYSGLTTAEGTLTVSKAPVTVTAENKTKKYGENVPALTYKAEGLKNGETLLGLNVKAELYTEATKTSPVGNYAIMFRNPVKETKNYEISYKDGTLNVGVFTGAVEIRALSAVKVYDGKELTKSAYSVRGSLASGDYIDKVVMTEDSRITDAGLQKNSIKYVVIKNAAGAEVTANYGNLKLADGQLIVTKAVAFVIAKSTYKVYGESNPRLEYETTGFVNGETPSGLGIEPKLETNADEKSPAGVYPITFDAPVISTANYLITYVPGILVVKRNAADIVITAKSGTKVYDGTALTEGGYEVSGQLASGDYVSSVEMTRESSITDVGTKRNQIKSVVIKNAAGENVTKNYSSLKTAEGTLTVSQAQVMVKAADKAKNYGEEIPALTYTVEGLKNGETLEGLHVTVEPYTEATKTSPAGDYKISFRNKVEETKNYKITYEDGNLSVGKNEATLVIKALDAEMAYDGTELTRSEYTVTGSLEDGDYIDKVVMTTDSRITDAGTQKNKINYVVIRNGAGQDVTESYAGLIIAEGTLTVNKAQITVTAADKTKRYGEEVPALEYTVKGLENGETLEGLGVKVTLSTEAAKTSPAGAYNIIFKDPEKETKNYRIGYEDGILVVEKNGEALVITALDAEKVYDGKELARAEYSMAGSLKAGDHMDKVAMTEDSRITNAGTQKNRIAYVVIKNAAGVDVTDSYSGLVTAHGTLTVHKADITVTAAHKSRTQGSSNPELTYSIQGLINGETLEGLGLKLQLTTEATGSSGAGNYAIRFVDPVSAIANYNIYYGEGVLTVERRSSGGSSGGSFGGGSGLTPNSSRPYASGGPGDNAVMVEPEPVPLAVLPGDGNGADSILLIDDGSIPLAGLPKTGDRSPILGFAAIISGILLAAYAAVSRKRKEEER